MFRPSHERRGPDRFLHAKLALFFLAAGFFAAGAVYGRDWAVLVAAGVALVGVVLGRVGRRPPPGDEGGGTE